MSSWNLGGPGLTMWSVLASSSHSVFASWCWDYSSCHQPQLVPVHFGEIFVEFWYWNWGWQQIQNIDLALLPFWKKNLSVFPAYSWYFYFNESSPGNLTEVLILLEIRSILFYLETWDRHVLKHHMAFANVLLSKCSSPMCFSLVFTP